MHSTSVPQAVGAPKTARGEELRRWESGPRRDHRPPAPGVVWWPKTPTGTSVPTRIPSGHVSAFQYTIYISCHSLSFKEQASFNIMAAVTITVILEPKNLVCSCFLCFPIYLPWSDETQSHDLNFWSVKPAFSPSSFTFIKRLFSFSCFLPLEWYHWHIWGCWNFFWQSWFQLVIHPARHFTWCILHISYISRVTIYSLDILFSQFGTSPFLHVQF